MEPRFRARAADAGADLKKAAALGGCMGNGKNDPVIERMRLASALLGCAAAVIGAAGCAAWVLGIDQLKNYLPGTVSLKFNAALLLALTGTGIALEARGPLPLRRRLVPAIGLFCALFAAATAAAYPLRLRHFFLDQLFYAEPAGAPFTSSPGRMALETAIGFLTAAAALLASRSDRPALLRLREAAAAALALAGAAVVMTYVFAGRLMFLTPASRTFISLPAGLGFMLAGGGLLAARPDAGRLALFASESDSGRLMRTLMPWALAIPPLLGWLQVSWDRYGTAGPAEHTVFISLLGAAGSAAFVYLAVKAGYAEERRKRDTREELEDLYNNAPCGYHSLDKDGVFVKINATELAMLGLRREDVVGRLHFTDVLTPGSVEVFRENFPEFLSTGAVKDMEFRIKRAGGGTFTGLVTATATRGPDGRFSHSRSVLVDISDRRRAEEEARSYARRLEDANKELESFSYSVSHDLRAPLRAIDGFSNMLEEEYAPRLDAEAGRLIGVIRSNTSKMSALIEDLLAFARAGRKELQYGRVDMAALAAEAWKEAVPEGWDGSVMIEDLPPAAGDAPALRQVWANLFSNAVKFTGMTPSPRVRVSARRTGGMVEYSVADNGAGFEQEYAGKLFRIFQRLHSDEDFKGTGVGLAIVGRIVGRHGGSVGAEGRAGAGAVFRFTLPAAKED